MNINLYDIGFSEQWAAEAKANAKAYASTLYLARVSSQYKGIYQVITENGEIPAEVSGKLDYRVSSAEDYPAVGDWVMVDRTEDNHGHAIIHKILPRRSCLKRKAAGAGSEYQVIAANIDTVFICMALNNDYNLRRLERYLSVVWDSMATPVVVLTKADVCTDRETKVFEVEQTAVGVDVVVTSALDGEGYSQISGYVRKGKTVAFIGSSGVGKSTLINKLMGTEILATKDTRNDDKGRHTTTRRQMLMLPDGGVVIDTPGMRELQLASADLSKSFADIEELAEYCHYRDCRHESEPKCAVKQAIQDGRLSAERLESYHKLQKELAFEERKSSLTAAQLEKQKVKDMLGTLNMRAILETSKKYKGQR